MKIKYDPKLKGTNQRLLNDGVYSIVPSVNAKKALKYKSIDDIVFDKITKCQHNSDQYFIIKYDKKIDCYSIMSLFSHQLLGITQITQKIPALKFLDQNKLEGKNVWQWRIKLLNDNNYTLRFKSTGLNLSFNNKFKAQLMRNNSNHFDFIPMKTIPNGIYTINSIIDSNIYLSKNDKKVKITKPDVQNQFFLHL